MYPHPISKPFPSIPESQHFLKTSQYGFLLFLYFHRYKTRLGCVLDLYETTSTMREVPFDSRSSCSQYHEAEPPRYGAVAAEYSQPPLQCRSDTGCVAWQRPGQCAYRGSAETPIDKYLVTIMFLGSTCRSLGLFVCQRIQNHILNVYKCIVVTVAQKNVFIKESSSNNEFHSHN